VSRTEYPLLRCISLIDLEGEKTMKTSKTQAVLFIYENLKEKGQISKADVLSELEISDLTFKRYVSELRSYLMNFNCPAELLYLKKEDRYRLCSFSYRE
jgi:hypothetical protein